ncbi:MAG: PTS sugar transporter subunit IIA [Isosphaeraceae bacterium]
MDLTMRDAAEIFSVPEGRIYRWIHEDDLPTREVNGQHYFNRTELLEWATVRRVKFSPDLFRDSAGAGEAVANDTLIESLERGGILSGVCGLDRREVLKEVVERMPLPAGSDRSVLLELFLAREAAGSTAVGDGIAIPHARHPIVLPVGKPMLTLCYLDRPLDFGAADRQPVHTLFVLISPTIRSHLRMLARVACALRDEPLRAVLKRHGSPVEVLREIRRVEETFVPKPVDPGGSA